MLVLSHFLLSHSLQGLVRITDKKKLETTMQQDQLHSFETTQLYLSNSLLTDKAPQYPHNPC